MSRMRFSSSLILGLCLLMACVVPFVFAENDTTSVVRVELEVETTDGKEIVAVAADQIAFNKERFVQATISAETFANNGNSALIELKSGDRDQCETFQTAYISLVSEPSFTTIPPDYASIVSRYEYAIQLIADEARDFYLYCYNNGGFSDFNYQLAAHGYNEGASMLNGIAREAVGSIGTINPVEPTATPTSPQPDNPDNSGDQGGDIIPGTELYFGEHYPKGEARSTLYLNQADGTTSQVAIHPNIIPFTGDNFTSVLLVSNAFVDFARLDILASMGDGDTSRCDDLLGAYTILSLSPIFTEVPAQYQAWVDEYETTIFMAVDGAKDLTQWCHNGGAFPTFSYTQAVAAYDAVHPRLVTLTELAINAFGIPDN